MLKRISELDVHQFQALFLIHNAMSPENLSADGELPRRVVKQRYDELNLKLKEMVSTLNLDQDAFNPDAIYTEFSKRRVSKQMQKPIKTLSKPKMAKKATPSNADQGPSPFRDPFADPY